MVTFYQVFALGKPIAPDALRCRLGVIAEISIGLERYSTRRIFNTSLLKFRAYMTIFASAIEQKIRALISELVDTPRISNWPTKAPFEEPS